MNNYVLIKSKLFHKQGMSVFPFLVDICFLKECFYWSEEWLVVNMVVLLKYKLVNVQSHYLIISYYKFELLTLNMGDIPSSIFGEYMESSIFNMILTFPEFESQGFRCREEYSTGMNLFCPSSFTPVRCKSSF